MSPSLALHSPVFLFYLSLAGVLLALGGSMLAVLTWGFRKNTSQAWAAYRGWLIMVPLLLAVFFLGRATSIGFVVVIAALAIHEFARATGLHGDHLLSGVIYAGIGAAGVACLMTDPVTQAPGWYGAFMALPAIVTAVLVAIPVFRNRAAGQLRLLALAVFGFLYFGWMFCHLAFLANAAYAYSYLGYLVLAVELNDVAAYVCGHWFGRRLLCSQVSPKKTWEGTLGASALSMLLPWALWFTLPHFGAWDCLMAGLIVAVGAPMGDLGVSVLKRDLGIKDMGTLIPGHGGVLDRIDSLCYVAPLFFYYVRCRFGLEAA